MNEAVTEYWLKNYAASHCTLCGNTGVIDTRATAITPAAVYTGRLNWCICPNGQNLRKGGANMEFELAMCKADAANHDLDRLRHNREIQRRTEAANLRKKYEGNGQ